jgi:uncharacterized damage-inducible protein DinB
MSGNVALRDHLVNLLEGRGAHRDLNYAFRGVPPESRGVRAPGLPYSLWELLEHIRISQWDILEFSRDAGHSSPEWPKGYWPDHPEPDSAEAWERSVRTVNEDLSQMVSLVRNPESDLFVPFEWGEGQTLLREALLVADHNAYHTGQAVALRRLLGIWPPEEDSP